MYYPVPPNRSQLAIGAAMAMNPKKLKYISTNKALKDVPGISDLLLGSEWLN